MKKKRGPFCTVKNGNVSVPIYLVENKGYREFRVAWYPEPGKRRLKAFAQEAEARRFAGGVSSTITSGDIKGLVLTENDRLVYQNALAALYGTGTPLDQATRDYAAAVQKLGKVTLKEAVDFYVKHNAGLEKRSVEQVVQELIRTKQHPGPNKLPASSKYLVDLESRLGRFGEAFQCNIDEITPAQILAFLNGLEGVTGRTWFNYARLIRTLFNFAKAKRYVSPQIDPMEGIDIEFVDDGEIEIFTPEELKKLFAAARPEIIPFLAVAAFAGVRHDEIRRLDWSNISATHIEIKAKQAKNRKLGGRARRVIPIQPNLAKWLGDHRKENGPIAPFANMAKQLLFLAADAGVEWKHNGLRHSFASYRLAQTNDENLVAVEMGNSPAMIQQSYRQIKDHTGRVITQAMADKWFAITPTQTGVNIIPIPEVVTTPEQASTMK